MGKIIGLVVVAVLLIGGFLYWNSRPKPVANDMPLAGQMDPNNEVAAKNPTPMAEEKGMVSSLKEAMGLGQKMQCTYAMSKGDDQVVSTVFIEGSKVKSTTTVGDMTMYSLMDGENQYSWTSASKTGMRMSKACLEKLQTSVKDLPKPAGAPTPAEPQDMEKAFDMAKNVKCEPASGADFTIPKDVTFTDQCAMLEQSTKLMQEMKDKLPAGMMLPSAPAPVQ
ncbi:MAG: hypothetical protein WBP40_03020 [Candidatus Moraniibacteriota bacterium]